MQLRVVSARVAMHKNGYMQGWIFAKVDIRKDVMPHVDSTVQHVGIRRSLHTGGTSSCKWHLPHTKEQCCWSFLGLMCGVHLHLHLLLCCFV